MESVSHWEFPTLFGQWLFLGADQGTNPHPPLPLLRGLHYDFRWHIWTTGAPVGAAATCSEGLARQNSQKRTTLSHAVLGGARSPIRPSASQPTEKRVVPRAEANARQLSGGPLSSSGQWAHTAAKNAHAPSRPSSDSAPASR